MVLELLDKEDKDLLEKLEWLKYYIKVIEFDVWRNEDLKNDINEYGRIFDYGSWDDSELLIFQASIEERLYAILKKDDLMEYLSIVNEFIKLQNQVLGWNKSTLKTPLRAINFIMNTTSDDSVRYLESLLIDKFRKKYNI